MGDWPEALVLDELWLRCRRSAVAALERRRVWPTAAEHEGYVAAAVEEGTELREGLLRAALGRDARLIDSDVPFGAANRALRRRLPQVLSFGAGLGRGFALLAGADDRAARYASGTGALFNLGVSVFDLLHDSSPDLVAVLPGRLDGPALARLTTDPAAAAALRRSAQQPIDDLGATLPAEIRILLVVVADFYARLHVAAGGAGLSPSLIGALQEAYQAEMSSLEGTGGERVARSSSVAPFTVLAEVALAAAKADDRVRADRLGELAAAIGEVFWLVDDLVDSVSDAQTGSLNALLTCPETGESWTPLVLLESAAIEAYAGRLGATVAHVDTLLGHPNWPDPNAAGQLRTLIRNGVRSWMS